MLLCNHILDMDLKLGCHCKDDNNSLYELIQCDFEDNVFMWLCNHILDMDVRLFLFNPSAWIRNRQSGGLQPNLT